MDILAYNRQAWDREVESGNQWTVPVSAAQVEAARRGEFEIYLTPTRPVPLEWFPELAGLEVLCLASGGGQQGPLLAAAGAQVTVLDNSPRQLAQDIAVAKREGLNIITVQGDMADLSAFDDERFGLIVHPVSNCFAPAIRPVWREAFRVLKPAGVLLAGFANPAAYIFDPELLDQEVLEVRYALPYSDLTSLSEEARKRYLRTGRPVEFGHTLEDQIGGQLDAGFLLAGLFEDVSNVPEKLAEFMPLFIATRAVKPAQETG
jgi:SAM-dependent methyltransferase